MAVPDYQSIMLPLLQRTAHVGKPTGMIEILPTLAADLHLSDDDLSERLPSGRQGVFHNRMHWAKHYLTRAGLLESTKRGLFQITEAGRALLATNPVRVDNDLLMQFPAFAAWRAGAPIGDGEKAEPAETRDKEVSKATPEERIELARRELDANLRAELLDRVRKMPPGDFEELVIELLVKMNYGQGREDMAQALGGSGGGGVDGVINQDPLGLDRVYIQAKRYKEGNIVGPSAIRDFIGALNIKRVKEGLFVTASNFTADARESAKGATLHVVLIDGDRMAELMLRHNVGVVVRHSVEIKAVDEGFFDA
jgi:restriction system protein